MTCGLRQKERGESTKEVRTSTESKTHTSSTSRVARGTESREDFRETRHEVMKEEEEEEEEEEEGEEEGGDIVVK
jgi:hypothetical protein